MRWEHPPIIKLYEALGAIADQRIILHDTTAKVYSSTGSKYYDVTYDAAQHAITSNDNGSYWVGYLGYPAISYLLMAGVIPYDPHFAQALKGIPWKDINTRFKNDFEQTEQYIRAEIRAHNRTIDLAQFDNELNQIGEAIDRLRLTKLGPTLPPPIGY